MHWVKEQGKVLAACDEELLGQKIEGEEKSIKVKEGFYKGKKVTEEKLRKLIEDYRNINLIGEETIKIAREQGKISQEMKIGNVPHAIIVTVKKRG